MKLSLVGTGLMGNPMAVRLHSAGLLKGAFNRSKEKTKNLESSGIKIYTDLRELFEENETVILMLSDYSAIKSLFFGRKLDFNGKTIIQMSTIAPEETIALAEDIQSLGGEFVEAPVLGSIPQIKEGSLIIMVGGEKEVFNKFSRVFNELGKNVYFVGEFGKASALKLALNQLIASLTSAFSMSLGFVRENEIDVNLFMDILRKSALYAPTFDKKLNRMLHRNFENPNFPLKHLLKDVKLMIESFEKQSIKIEPLEGVKKVLERGITNGLSELDYSALYNSIHQNKK